jgi:hypothetical protein
MIRIAATAAAFEAIAAPRPLGSAIEPLRARPGGEDD